MKVLALMGSPRKGGNCDLLLDEFLRGVGEGEVEKFFISDLNISPCRECLDCYAAGECVIKDGMEELSPKLLEAERLVLAAPIFFYGLPAQFKALIDRGQVFWARKYLLGFPPPRSTRSAFVILTGATGGKKLFNGALLTLTYFLETLGVKLSDRLLLRKAGEPEELPDKIRFEARRAGYNFAGGKDRVELKL